MPALLREAGGFGDIICLGAAARQVSMGLPGEPVVACIPEEFRVIAEHLIGIDEIASLGSLAEIRPARRDRCGEMDVIRHPYLAPIPKIQESMRVVDLYCPGQLYEQSAEIPRYGRSQIFSMASGARSCLNARPEWRLEDRDRDMASTRLGGTSPPYIAVQLRSTCPARSLSIKQSVDLCRMLSASGTCLYVDCIQPRFLLPSGCVAIIDLPWPILAGVIAKCSLVIAIDSALIHLAAGLDISCLGLFGPTVGNAICGSYPKAQVMQGESSDCPRICHYSESRGWRPEVCRTRGCVRTMSLMPEVIVDKAERMLREGAA